MKVNSKGIHRLKIDNGIFLDGERLNGVREYSVIHNEHDDLACLTLKMDVTILGNCHAENSVDKSREIFQELIRIRKELQAIRSSVESERKILIGGKEINQSSDEVPELFPD